MQRKSLNIVEIYNNKNDFLYCKIIHVQMNNNKHHLKFTLASFISD